MGNPPRRRHIFRDAQVTADWTVKLDTRTARAIFAATEVPELQHSQFGALVAVAHFIDMTTIAGTYAGVTYAEDINDILGCGTVTAARYMNELKRLGLLVGSAPAGYNLVDRLNGGPLIVAKKRTAT